MFNLAKLKGVNMKTRLANISLCHIVLLGVCVSVSGCNVGWVKPGSTQAEFNVDKYDCQTEAAHTYPVAIVQRSVGTGYQTSSQTQCVASGYGNYNCTTTGGNYVPPNTVTEDANLNNRNMAFQNCMQAKGYEFKMEFKSQSTDSTSSVETAVAPKTDYEIAAENFKNKNYAAAFAIYKKLADAGNVDAQLQVGNMYFTGQGVSKDYAQAFYWFKKVADNGSKLAQKKIAIMYESGYGVERNQREADAWYKRAEQKN